MFKRLIHPVLHLVFLVTRPLTIGVRGICYDPENHSILLVKHTYADEWALPGGGVEAGESIFVALRRELREEAGVFCESATILDVYHNVSLSKRDHVISFLVEAWRMELSHTPPKLEISKTAWFTLDDLPPVLTPCTQATLETWLKNFPPELS